jgi:hypothetical protein
MELFAFASLAALQSAVEDAPEATDHVAVLNYGPQQTTVEFYSSDAETQTTELLDSRTYDFEGEPISDYDPATA